MKPFSCIVLIAISVLFVSCYSKPIQPDVPLNINNVVIGIIDQPVINEDGCNLSALGDKYLPASYVKLVESTGARVVPIPFDAPLEKLEELFNSVNGIIFPGGDADFTPGTLFYNNAQYLFNLTIAANDAGDYFPLIGICQGMEMLTVMMANSQCSILDFDYSAQNISLPLDFNENAKDSILFGNLPDEIYDSLNTQNVTFNAHNNGLSPQKYSNSTSLQNFVTVLSTNFDRNGKEFVSSYEGKEYPIWGIQFHPSRLAYEWKPYEDMNHSPQAIADMQFIAYTLYGQAKFNHHTFSPEVLQDTIIYRYPPVYTAPICSMFEQCYLWKSYPHY